MTIISTAKSPVSLEDALDIAETRAYNKARPSFPPVNDAVTAYKKIDWADVRARSRKGFNNVGIVVAVLGEKIHDLGTWMAKFWCLYH